MCADGRAHLAPVADVEGTAFTLMPAPAPLSSAIDLAHQLLQRHLAHHALTLKQLQQLPALSENLTPSQLQLVQQLLQQQQEPLQQQEHSSQSPRELQQPGMTHRLMPQQQLLQQNLTPSELQAAWFDHPAPPVIRDQAQPTQQQLLPQVMSQQQPHAPDSHPRDSVASNGSPVLAGHRLVPAGLTPAQANMLGMLPQQQASSPVRVLPSVVLSSGKGVEANLGQHGPTQVGLSPAEAHQDRQLQLHLGNAGAYQVQMGQQQLLSAQFAALNESVDEAQLMQSHNISHGLQQRQLGRSRSLPAGLVLQEPGTLNCARPLDKCEEQHHLQYSLQSESRIHQQPAQSPLLPSPGVRLAHKKSAAMTGGYSPVGSALGRRSFETAVKPGHGYAADRNSLQMGMHGYVLDGHGCGGTCQLRPDDLMKVQRIHGMMQQLDGCCMHGDLHEALMLQRGARSELLHSAGNEPLCFNTQRPVGPQQGLQLDFDQLRCCSSEPIAQRYWMQGGFGAAHPMRPLTQCTMSDFSSVSQGAAAAANSPSHGSCDDVAACSAAHVPATSAHEDMGGTPGSAGHWEVTGGTEMSSVQCASGANLGMQTPVGYAAASPFSHLAGQVAIQEMLGDCHGPTSAPLTGRNSAHHMDMVIDPFGGGLPGMQQQWRAADNPSGRVAAQGVRLDNQLSCEQQLMALLADQDVQEAAACMTQDDIMGLMAFADQGQYDTVCGNALPDGASPVDSSGSAPGVHHDNGSMIVSPTSCSFKLEQSSAAANDSPVSVFDAVTGHDQTCDDLAAAVAVVAARFVADQEAAGQPDTTCAASEVGTSQAIQALHKEFFDQPVDDSVTTPLTHLCPDNLQLGGGRSRQL